MSRAGEVTLRVLVAACLAVDCVIHLKLADAIQIGPRHFQHTHAYVIDPNHPRWPSRTPAYV